MENPNYSPRPTFSPDPPAGRGRAGGGTAEGGVTVIIPNLNGRKHLPRCLESLRRTAGIDFEVLVADNGSSDGGVEWVRENHPRVGVLDLGENRGFSGALMAGVRRSSRPLVCFLNNDTEVRPDWLLRLARTLNSDREIGAVSATLLYMHDPEMINFGGGGMTWPGYGYQERLGWPLSGLKGAPAASDTLFPSGAAMLISRRLLLECGGLDEELHPIYHEDVDLGWRLWIMGYRVVIDRKAVVLHHEGGGPAPRPGAGRIAALGFRHSMRCSIKNYETGRVFPALAALAFSQILGRMGPPGGAGAPGKRGIAPPLSALPGMAAALYQTGLTIAGALSWNLIRIGDTLRQRRFVQARRRRSDAELLDRGLIRRRPWLPFQGDHRAGWKLPFDRLFLRPELRPAEDSAIGRLSGGWGPTWTQRDRRGRTLMYLARCRLRVEPAAAGRLEITAGLTDAADRGALRVICNGSVSGWEELKGGDPRTISGAVESDERGELKIEILADSAGYSRRKPGWWAVVYGIRFHPDKPPRPRSETPEVSVIIPTFNRCSYLRDCLSALAGQTSPPREVILIDDGSTDGTPEFLAAYAAGETPPFALKTARTVNSGPAAARNRGIEMASGDLIAFLGDDMMADPDWLKNHLAAHRARGFSGAICGFTDWDRSRMPATPFLEFVNLNGYQFDYGSFRPGGETPFTGFYTSNLSLPARFLREERFDEWFRKAAFEDSELGYRLCAGGMPIVYEPRCRVRHRHPMTAEDFCRRQRTLGELLARMIDRRPELESYFPVRAATRFQRWWLGRAYRPAADRVLPPLDRMKIRLPATLYHLWLYAHLIAGAGRARAERPPRGGADRDG